MVRISREAPFLAADQHPVFSAMIRAPVFLTPSADGVSSAAGSSLCAPWRPAPSAPPRSVSVPGGCSLGRPPPPPAAGRGDDGPAPPGACGPAKGEHRWRGRKKLDCIKLSDGLEQLTNGKTLALTIC